jgi:uncharacterized protein (TIGR04255 family)
MQLQFQFKNPMVFPFKIDSSEIQNNIGFKFTEFENGSPAKVLQGQNDSLNNRTFISYHSLNYTRWNPFYSDYVDVIKKIAKHNQDIFITAISLHYIDQFFWIENSAIDLNLIFDKNANSIPKDFFGSKLNNYSIITEKEISTGTSYLDRLEIIVDNIIKPSITISHNVTQPFVDLLGLDNLIGSNQFELILNSAHLHNKSFLKDLLNKEIQEMINLQ